MLKDLFVKYLNGTISPEEFERLYAMMQEENASDQLDGLLEQTFSDPSYAVDENLDKAAIFAGLLERVEEAPSGMPERQGERDIAEITPAPVIRQLHGSRRRWIAAAALILLTTGAFLLYRWSGKSGGQMAQTENRLVMDVPPGKDGAILTLADGRQVSLDSMANGLLQPEGSVQLRKEDGQISYRADGNAGASLYNTITTPRGRQFRLILSDGTRVMLNAASSIRYPTVFSGKERKVFVNGEAYFETAQDKERPFIVEGSRAEVQVLGTSFDISDYSDEPYMNTTLLTGAVRLGAGSDGAQLMPGQQGEIDRASGKLSVRQVDTTQVTAWIKGMLALNSGDLATEMRQVARWYDVDIVFAGKPSDIRIGGMIHRNVNLSILLEFLKENGLHYTTNGKTITIAP